MSEDDNVMSAIISHCGGINFPRQESKNRRKKDDLDKLLRYFNMDNMVQRYHSEKPFS